MKDNAYGVGAVPHRGAQCRYPVAVGPDMYLQRCQVLRCNVIGLQETRGPRRTKFTVAGYRVFYGGEDGSSVIDLDSMRLG